MLCEKFKTNEPPDLGVYCTVSLSSMALTNLPVLPMLWPGFQYILLHIYD